MHIRSYLRSVFYIFFKKNNVILLDFPQENNRVYLEGTDNTKANPHVKLNKKICLHTYNYESILMKCLKYADFFSRIKKENEITNSIEPGWNNGFMPGLDIIVLYTLIAEKKPKSYIEIGSGNSTKVVKKSKKDHSLNCSIISIDPSPRREVKEIADVIYEKKVQEVSLDIFKLLEENDIVFFDGSHSLYQNSDVMWFFLEILPILKKGVIIQIHDIYLPFDYPDEMLNRGYNEQYVLASSILSNENKYEIICPNYFIYTQKKLHALLEPIWGLPQLKKVEQHGGSFWFTVKE